MNCFSKFLIGAALPLAAFGLANCSEHGIATPPRPMLQEKPAKQDRKPATKQDGAERDLKRFAGPKQRKSDKAGSAPADRQPKTPKLSAEREEQLIEFVREHNPEIVNLLNLLKFRHDAQYRRAMNELNRVYDRLTLLQERDPERYELDLEAWQIKSRIDLLTARMAMNDPGVDEGYLRRWLAKQMDVRRRQLELEQDRLQERMQRIESQLKNLDTQSPQEIDRQYAAILRGVKRFRQQRSQLKGQSDAAATSPNKRAK